MQKLLILLACLIAVSSPALAQSNNVEINLDSLKGYTPPPMFANPPPVVEPPEIEVLTPAPIPERAVPLARIVNVPLPAKKPPFNGVMKKRPSDLDESQIVLQNAQDILRQLGGPEAPVGATQPKASPIAKKAPPIDTGVKNKTALLQGDEFEVVLPFTSGETALTDQHKKILLQQVVLRLQKYENARLEVRAYASSTDHQKSPAKRLSLERALAVREFLGSKTIPARKVFLRPLGKSAQENSDYVELVISRL